VSQPVDFPRDMGSGDITLQMNDMRSIARTDKLYAILLGEGGALSKNKAGKQDANHCL